MQYNWVSIYIFVNVVEIYNFKAKGSAINVATLCLGNISKGSWIDNKKKTILYGNVYDFSVDYDSIDIDVLQIFLNI